MTQRATGVGTSGRGLAALRAHPVLWKWLVAPAIVTLLRTVLRATVGAAGATIADLAMRPQ